MSPPPLHIPSVMLSPMSDPVTGRRGGGRRWHLLGCAWRTVRYAGVFGGLWALGSEWWFDFRRGTETWWPAGGTQEGDGVPYQGVSPAVFRDAMGAVPKSIQEGVFVDLGCGKGRALILAAEAGFRRLVGVDLDPALIRVCRRNMRKVRARNGWPSVEVEVMDALQFRCSPGKSVVFLYNPFRGETLRQVAMNLAEQGAREGNQVWVVYVNPVELGMHFKTGFRVEKEGWVRGRRVWAVLRCGG